MTPRLIASSATPCCVQWVIWYPLSRGVSQAIAMIAQICSAVKVAGRPFRGSSASRAATSPAGWRAIHRRRQTSTVFRQIPSRRAVSPMPTSSAASRIMRARSTSRCGAVRVRTKLSRNSRSCSDTSTGSGDNPGMASSPTNAPRPTSKYRTFHRVPAIYSRPEESICHTRPPVKAEYTAFALPTVCNQCLNRVRTSAGVY